MVGTDSCGIHLWMEPRISVQPKCATDKPPPLLNDTSTMGPMRRRRIFAIFCEFPRDFLVSSVTPMSLYYWCHQRSQLSSNYHIYQFSSSSNLVCRIPSMEWQLRASILSPPTSFQSWNGLRSSTPRIYDHCSS